MEEDRGYKPPNVAIFNCLCQLVRVRVAYHSPNCIEIKCAGASHFIHWVKSATSQNTRIDESNKHHHNINHTDPESERLFVEPWEKTLGDGREANHWRLQRNP